MVKFLHTADWQLGMKATMLGNAAPKVRAARYKTIEKILETANEKDVDFILVAGDIFENNGVSEEVVTAACEALIKSNGIPIYILPGNHDPISADTVYHRKSWIRQIPPNIKVLEKAEPLKVKDGVILYPCPLKQKISKIDPTAWILKEDSSVIRIGLAHGALNIGLSKEKPPFPIAPDRAEVSGLDYLALGDWHSLFIHSDKRTLYPGTPEPTAFGEKDSGHAVIVDIEKCGALPIIEPLNTAHFNWTDIQAEISSQDDIDKIVTQLGSTDDPSRIVARVIMKGAVSVDVKQYISSIQIPSLTFLKIDDSGVYLKPEEDALLSSMPGNIAKDTMQSLLLLLSQNPANKIELSLPPEEIKERLQQLLAINSITNTPTEVIEKAIEHLYVLSREVGE